MRPPVIDTTNFFDIDCGDEIHVGGNIYRITGNEKERRFGIEDPKFWVKQAVDATTGERKIVKLAYFEKFDTILGGVTINCFRDPDKESAILETMKDNPHFMKGISFKDSKNNNIRVLDIVRGPNFWVYLDRMQMDHETYFHDQFPGIFQKLMEAFQAIAVLHSRGCRHGDIRNDHLVIEINTDNYVWIDFDYDYLAPENPFSLDLFGIGNILLYAAGKGIHDVYSMVNFPKKYGDLIDRVDTGDFSILDKSRLMNLKKFYPYIPDHLNNILLHFSRNTEIYYESIGEILDDLAVVDFH